MSFSKVNKEERLVGFVSNQIIVLIGKENPIQSVYSDGGLLIFTPSETQLNFKLPPHSAIIQSTSITKVFAMIDQVQVPCEIIIDRIDMMTDKTGKKIHRASIIKGAMSVVNKRWGIIITTCSSEHCVNESADQVIVVNT